jgi:putative Holliday junction resolvase
MGRILAIDPGEARAGLAVSDPLGLTAHGLPTWERRSGTSWPDHLDAVIREWDVTEIVLGNPLHLNGRPSEGSRRSEEWKRVIQERWDLPVLLVDERLTTVEAERVLREAGGKRREKGRTDRLAAVLLLQTVLDGRDREEGTPREHRPDRGGDV